MDDVIEQHFRKIRKIVNEKLLRIFPINTVLGI